MFPSFMHIRIKSIFICGSSSYTTPTLYRKLFFHSFNLSLSMEALSLEKLSNIQLHTIPDLITAGKKRCIYKNLPWGRRVALQLIGYLIFTSVTACYHSVQYSCTANNQGICLLPLQCIINFVCTTVMTLLGDFIRSKLHTVLTLQL